MARQKTLVRLMADEVMGFIFGVSFGFVNWGFGSCVELRLESQRTKQNTGFTSIRTSATLVDQTRQFEFDRPILKTNRWSN